MSFRVQLSASILAAIASCLMSVGSAVWFTSAASNDISRLKVDVEAVKVSDGEQGKTLTRLDERSIIILDTVRRIEERR